ncbi:MULTISPECIES: sigma factor-like helix-turn-helix DNA-binding protein [Actinomycetes]|uniref:RNA polymerase subunit sigma-70 n=2 Tax=Streptomyces rimosus subsp. rimosus TaxID=132474 RepID=L8ET82_STRR1|nr:MULTISPECIES: sigma factor-like helix-turn-helix DNA-binding protein [Streptomyces]KOG83790.1 RNA polymerase sigma70 [Kitasatospora aureofaciens]MYT42747.1 RNA polymerase subunit sigma-70 [Streptomyces sp. SID5471]KEF07227.1 RNA polymerase sigma70 [Streptomyces rimosus]KEF19559.1 RNA polymerase sigma70 [Streptomyces rimosus]KUJ42013.1 RNA polymerase subunit sigma-70 [Streptomyces rimosus subsp. rimosus]
MRERRAAQERRRAREFEAFVAGAAGRLLRAATLLTAEPEGQPAPAAERLLTLALARTYAAWDRLRGEDPYDRARQEMAAHYAHSAWRARLPRALRPGTPPPSGGLLERLSPQERLVLVLRLYEGVAEEQTAAQLGLPAERVHTLCLRAVGHMRSKPRAGRSVSLGGEALHPVRDVPDLPHLPDSSAPQRTEAAAP